MLTPTRERDLAKTEIFFLSCSWVHFLSLWRVSRDHFGKHLAALEAFLGALEPVLGHSWALLGRSWAPLSRILALFDRLLVLMSSPGALLMHPWNVFGLHWHCLGRSGDALGHTWGNPGALLGRSEGALGRYGALFGVLGFVLGSLGFMLMISLISLPAFLYVFFLASLLFAHLRSRNGLGTLPHASPFSSDTGIPAHVGRLCSPLRWTLRHMPQAF